VKKASAKSLHKTSKSAASATSSPELAGGPSLYDSPDGLSLFPCGPEVVPVSRSRRRANGKAKATSDTCGLSFSGSSASAALQLSLASRLQALMGCDGSMEYSLIWKERATPAGRRICALRASARRTSASDCSGWPTPKTTEHQTTFGRGNLSLNGVAMLSGWPTPQTHDTQEQGQGRPLTLTGRIQCHNGDSRSLDLLGVAQLAGWATPTVTDVRVQRLQDISAADAIAEGCHVYASSATIDCDTPDPRQEYRRLWNDLHGPDAWAANPWVAALTFTVHRQNIDQLNKGATK
jgi:hypothetical protein